MKSHATENFLPAVPIFHVVRADGLFQPIRFAFVNERMRAQILSERDAILDALPPATRARQQHMFGRYDPNAWHRQYRGLLDRFAGSATHEEPRHSRRNRRTRERADQVRAELRTVEKR